MSTRVAKFIEQRRDALADRWVSALQARSASSALSREQLRNSILGFIDEVANGLRAMSRAEPEPEALREPSSEAKSHGQQRFGLGYDLEALIREYATLRDVLFAAFEEGGLSLTAEESRNISTFLVEGIASAATQYNQERDARMREQTAEHIGFIAHELRNPLQDARLRLEVIKLRPGGPTPFDLRSLERSLGTLGERIDNALLDGQLRAFPDAHRESLDLRALLMELVEEVAPKGDEKGIEVLLSADTDLGLEADRRLLHSAISNLLRNALKFSRAGTTVELRAKRAEGRVVVEIEDACGGLPEGAVQRMFDPFVQLGADRSGFGLGLAIAKQATEAHGGALRVHDLPGRGCVFVLDLPEREVPPADKASSEGT